MPVGPGRAALPAADRLVVHPPVAADEHVVHRALAGARRRGRARPARARRGTRRRRAGSPRRCPRRPRPAATAATTVPGGATTRTGRIAPPFAGIVGSVAARDGERDRAHGHRLDRVHVARALRVGAGEVERRSRRRRPSPSPRSASATAAPGAARPSRARPRTCQRRRAAPPARRACAVRRSRRSRRAAPPTRARRRAAHALDAEAVGADAARRGRRAARPGVREHATKIAATPASSRTGGMRSPSWSISVASGGIEPGAIPPRSAWWARFADPPDERAVARSTARRA